jgi:ribonuclease BN (tRNA processing enzyme)
VRLTIIGCSGSFPGPDSPASCYLVEAEGFRLLIDFGSGALSALQRHAGLYGIDAICVSHLHADHCLDLCCYSVALTYHPEGPRPRIPVYAPAQAVVRLGRALTPDPAAADARSATGTGHGMTDAYDFTELTPGVIEIGPLRVTAAAMNHPVETFGFRVEHAGRSLAYSADTGPTDALEHLAAGADVLLCEASFLEPAAGEPARPEGLHLTGLQAGRAAAAAGVGQLMLTHITPWTEKADALDEASQAFTGPICLAATGLGLTIG